MKTDKTAINLLFFTYAFFSFTINMPEVKMTASDWIRQIGLYCVIYIVFVLFAADNRKFKPLTNLLILIYIISLISIQTLNMWNYMKIYHGQTSANSTILLTFFTILLLSFIKDSRIAQLYFLLFAGVVLLMVILFILNVGKISSYNLYTQSQNNQIVFDGTLFDYIVPYIASIKSTGRKAKSTAVFSLIFTNLAFIIITISAFMTIKGNLLYSLSPLQMLFQVSSTSLIRNFDALFNYLVYFSYFGALVSLITSYSIVKKSFPYFNRWDLLLTVPFLVLYSKYELPVLWIESAMVIIMVIGRERKGYYEKTTD